jgi:hypothetical protein
VAEYQQLSAQLKKVLAQIRELGGSVPNPPEDVPPDSENAPDEQPRLEVYSISTADPKTVRRVLEEGFQDLISKKTGPHIQLEVSGKQLIARATPSQHRMIRELIKGISLKQSDSALLNPTQDTPKEQPFWGSYLISNADPDAVRRVLQTLFVGDVIVRVDGQGKLIALATPSQHREIKDAIKKMGYMMTDKPKSKEDIEVRVFQLRGQDAKTAMLTIEKLYGKAGPIVDGVRDPDLLVVRGTPSQLQEVEKLLPQLGVTKYRIDDSVAPGSSTPDADIDKRLKRLEAAVEKLLKANE